MRLALLLGAALLLCAENPNVLTPAEQRQGWKLLFNGRTLDGWTWTQGSEAPLPSWTAEHGLLRTRDSFTDFEFAFEWKAEAGANSGVKYRFQGYWVEKQLRTEPEGSGRIEPVALEYQITDDERHPDALTGPIHATAAVYEYWPAQKPRPAGPDVWHKGRIVAKGLHIEHWLDGKQVVNIQLDTPEVQAAFERSKRRGSSPVLAGHQRRSSPLALQFHDGKVWFRNLKIRPL